MTGLEPRTYFTIAPTKHKGYVQLHINEENIPSTRTQKLQALQEYFSIKAELIAKGYKGWLTCIDLDNSKIELLLKKAPARHYATEQGKKFFVNNLVKEN